MENSFGAFLAQKRKEKGLTQSELADIMCVSESAISKWETDKAYPDITRVTKLANLFGVTEHELLSASIDDNSRNESRQARKWRSMVKAYNLFFLIGYGIALLSCLIVNLCQGGLTWFWTVFFALVLAASFTTTPQLFRKYRALHVSFSEYLALALLLAVCCIRTGGIWFLTSMIPITFAYILVMMPIFIHLYDFPAIVKKNNALICILLDYVLLIGMLAYLSGERFVKVSLPIASYCLLIPLAVALVAKLKVNGLVKTGIDLLVEDILLTVVPYVVACVLTPVYGEGSVTMPFKDYNLLAWNADTVSGNIMVVITVGIAVIGLAFLVIGLRKREN